MKFMPKTFDSHLPLIQNILIEVQPMSLPSGLLFYMDYRYDSSSEQATGDVDLDPKKSLKDVLNEHVARFPHACPRCGAGAYIGLNVVECSRKDCR